MCYYWIKVAALHQCRGQIYLMEGLHPATATIYTPCLVPPPKNQQQLDYPMHGQCVCSMSHLNQGSVSDLAVQCLDMWCQVHVQQEVILQETAQSYTALSVCVRARSYYATAGAHTLLWRMCSVTSGVGSSFSLLATLESEEATSTSWTQFWSLLIYVSLFFLVLNKCIKVRYNVWAFHSASESSEIYSPLSSEDSILVLRFLPFSTLNRQSQLIAV